MTSRLTTSRPAAHADVSLLLHGLESVTPEHFRSDVGQFIYTRYNPSNKNSVLVAPPQSGKTYALLDYMATNYCIYLNCDSTRDVLGDPLMEHVINMKFDAERGKNDLLMRTMTVIVVAVHAGCLRQYLLRCKTKPSPYQWLIFHLFATRELGLAAQGCEFLDQCVALLHDHDHRDDRVLLGMKMAVQSSLKVLYGQAVRRSVVLDNAHVLSGERGFCGFGDAKDKNCSAFTPVVGSLSSIMRVFIAATSIDFEELDALDRTGEKSKKYRVPVISDLGGVCSLDALHTFMAKISPSLVDILSQQSQQLLLDQLAGRFGPVVDLLTRLLLQHNPSPATPALQLAEGLVAQAISQYSSQYEASLVDALSRDARLKQIAPILALLLHQYQYYQHIPGACFSDPSMLLNTGLARLCKYAVSDQMHIAFADEISPEQPGQTLKFRITDVRVAAAIQRTLHATGALQTDTILTQPPAALRSTLHFHAAKTTSGLCESVLARFLNVALDPAHPFHRSLFSAAFSKATKLHNIRLRRGTRSRVRAVCVAGDVDCPYDVISHFLDDCNAQAPFLYPQRGAGPSLVCVLTADNVDGNVIEIPMLIRYEMSDTPDWTRIWTATRPEELYTSQSQPSTAEHGDKDVPVVDRTKISVCFPPRSATDIASSSSALQQSPSSTLTASTAAAATPTQRTYPWAIRMAVAFDSQPHSRTAPPRVTILKKSSKLRALDGRNMVMGADVSKLGHAKHVLVTLMRGTDGAKSPLASMLHAAGLK